MDKDELIELMISDEDRCCMQHILGLSPAMELYFKKKPKIIKGVSCWGLENKEGKNEILIQIDVNHINCAITNKHTLNVLTYDGTIPSCEAWGVLLGLILEKIHCNPTPANKEDDEDTTTAWYSL